MKDRPLHASLGRWSMSEKEKEKEIISDPSFLLTTFRSVLPVLCIRLPNNFCKLITNVNSRMNAYIERSVCGQIIIGCVAIILRNLISFQSGHVYLNRKFSECNFYLLQPL